MICDDGRHSPCPVNLSSPEPDPYGRRHLTLTWDVHTDMDNIHIVSRPCTNDDCPAWLVDCQMCGPAVETITFGGPNAIATKAHATAARHGTTHADGCRRAFECGPCQAHWHDAAERARSEQEQQR